MSHGRAGWNPVGRPVRLESIPRTECATGVCPVNPGWSHVRDKRMWLTRFHVPPLLTPVSNTLHWQIWWDTAVLGHGQNGETLTNESMFAVPVYSQSNLPPIHWDDRTKHHPHKKKSAFYFNPQFHSISNHNYIKEFRDLGHPILLEWWRLGG